MIRIHVILILFLIQLSACSSQDKSKSIKPAIFERKEGLKIYAFHGTRQCETCKNMKAYTKATLVKYFKSELNSGAIVYQVIDVDDEKNAEIAEKYEATGTALMINSIKNEKDHIEDWSDFAFEYAPGEQQDFELELKKKIQEKLK